MKVVVTKENNIQYEASILDDDLINGGELFIGRDDDCHVVLEASLSVARARYRSKMALLDYSHRVYIDDDTSWANLL